VSVVFNNEKKQDSPIGYEHCNQITVTRQIRMGGKNRYKINGRRALVGQVSNLFQSVQLDINNPHFLIPQGRINKVIQAKPKEILAMVEEAAGTRMFETKKAALLKTLEHQDGRLAEIQKAVDSDITPQLDQAFTMAERIMADRKVIASTIAELDRRSHETLNKTWQKVNADFGSIFSILLPGTRVKLEPPEGKTVMDGLEMKIAFGQRWKESLVELSGGQRALLALSLILSLLLSKPAPMYIFDEVDAALDLSHTQNVGTMLRTHFSDTQFIVVSHKKGMFNNANAVFHTKRVTRKQEHCISTVTHTVGAALAARRLVVKLAARERRSGKIACKGGVWDALPVPPDAAALTDSFAGAVPDAAALQLTRDMRLLALALQQPDEAAAISWFLHCNCVARAPRTSPCCTTSSAAAAGEDTENSGRAYGKARGKGLVQGKAKKARVGGGAGVAKAVEVVEEDGRPEASSEREE
jgi:ABC-type dipeptide/oligopeptide/nickel transport system ATPase subunit